MPYLHEITGARFVREQKEYPGAKCLGECDKDGNLLPEKKKAKGYDEPADKQ
jgi:hypothetical protein